MADHYDDRGINYSRLLRASTFYGLATEESNELAAVHAPTLVNKLTLAIESQQHTGRYYTEAEHEAAQKAIAAHEAKRAMPEEWLAEAQKRVQNLVNASVAYSWTGSGEAKANIDRMRDALIAHISTPPAGMVLVPEEPEEWRVKAALKVNLANADERAIVSAPKSFSFEDVNHWVHIDSPGYEELQWNSLGMAQHIDGLQGRLAKLDISEEEMRREFEKPFRRVDLARNEDGEYFNEMVANEWVGFCAGIKLMQERCK